MSIPTEVIMKMATIGLSEAQAQAVADMLSAVEQATAAVAEQAADASREKVRARVAKWRAKQVGNVTERSVTSRNGLRAHSETSNSVIEEKKESKVRACRLPTDFAPDVLWAVSQGISLSQANAEAAKFRDYWSAKGANATKTDWPATWRNWIRSALERKPTGPPGQQAPSMSQLFQAIRDAPHENQPEPPEDRSSLRPAISHLRAVGSG